MSHPMYGITREDRLKMGEWARNGIKSEALKGVRKKEPEEPEPTPELVLSSVRSSPGKAGSSPVTTS